MNSEKEKQCKSGEFESTIEAAIRSALTELRMAEKDTNQMEGSSHC